MIKVIKHGVFNSRTCIRCGCVFSFEKEDVELKEINGYWTGAVTCPECKADNKVERWQEVQNNG